MIDTEKIDLVTKRFNAARNNQIAWFNKFIRYYALYRSNQLRKNYYGRANLFVPASFWTVESFVPRIFRSLRKINAIPQEETDVPNAKAVTSLLEYQRQRIGWDDLLRQWIRGAGIYGSYPAKVSWDYNEQMGTDQPKIELVDINDFFIDPYAEKLDQARWVIHRTQKHIDELMASKLYKNLDKIMPKGSPMSDEGYKTQRKAIVSVTQRPFDSTAKLVDIYEYWGYMPGSPGKPDQNRVITVANKNTIIRDEKNPFEDIIPGNALPFVMMYDTDVPHEIYGIGEIEPIEKLQEELNDTRNQRMDNVTLNINRMFEVIRSANVSEEDFIAMPGKVFYSNIPNGIRALDVADMTQSAYEEEQLIKQDINQTTVGTPNSDIQQQAQEGSATGVLAMQEAGDTRTEYKVMNMQDAVRKVWRMVLALDQEFIDKTFVIRLEGKQGVTFQKLKPKDIKGNFDIDVQVESQQNKLVKKQEKMQLYQLALKTPGANIGKAYMDLLDEFEVSNPEEYYQQQQPGPPTPSVSISLRGELGPMGTDEIAKLAKIDPKSVDPMLRPQLRRLVVPNSKEPPMPDETEYIDNLIKLQNLENLKRNPDKKPQETTEVEVH